MYQIILKLLDEDFKKQRKAKIRSAVKQRQKQSQGYK